MFILAVLVWQIAVFCKSTFVMQIQKIGKKLDYTEIENNVILA